MAILSLVEFVFMRLSPNRRIDGLWVGVLGDRGDDGLLTRVEDALMLIRQHDEIIYRQIHRCIKRIWINPLLAARGQFDLTTGTCGLDYQFVKSASVVSVASTIVHEATHAHPCMRKFGYPEALRYRIERICMRRQLAFVSNLPDGAEEQANVESNLALPPSYWLAESRQNLRVQSAVDGLRRNGVPDWLIRIMVGINEWLTRSRRARIS